MKKYEGIEISAPEVLAKMSKEDFIKRHTGAHGIFAGDKEAEKLGQMHDFITEKAKPVTQPETGKPAEPAKK